jgi:hypothetical protein
MHRTTQNKKYIEQNKKLGRVWVVPHLCGFYPDIGLTTEEKARKNLSQGSRRMPTGTMKNANWHDEDEACNHAVLLLFSLLMKGLQACVLLCTVL